ncbi:Glycosyltransferase [hydrothermal vent metagenome]|uniref:Glycosyltransferase n=1 Tax=hydrothermal vent metagenome TaxID=652676 RepID=A0A1W1BL43_9ZZZZ
MNILKPFQIIKNNPMLLKKIWFYLKRGEIAYLLSKGKEKSKENNEISKDTIEIFPKEYFTKFNIENYQIDISIDIIIPVYNGFEFLESLFNSLEANTSSAHRLIVIDDCSPDKRVKPYLLKRLEKHKNHIFIEHKENLGFVKSVNEGYFYTKNHFVILNTDTEVPEFWLERVIYPILKMDKVASTTPFTNSGQIASFPNFILDNDIFEGMSVDELDKSFRDVNATNFYAEAPTGVGFCMGINYNLTKDIGFFLEDEFGRGYGEENDWCQRAINNGYKNLIVPNLFVYHKHGGSFSMEDKKKLIKENSIKLLHKHPNYDRDVQDYIKRDIHKELRNILIIIASSTQDGVHLIINQALGGGSNIYSNNLVKIYKKENKRVLQLIYNYYTNSFIIYFDYKDYNFSFEIKTFDEVQIFLEKVKLKEIFINNLVSFKEIENTIGFIKKLVKRDNPKLVTAIHDYFIICPNYMLLNLENRYCNIPDNLEECNSCLKSSNLEWKTLSDNNMDIIQWRKNFKELLDISNSIICFSNSSKDILLKAYNSLNIDKIVVIPHRIEPLREVNYVKEDKKFKIIGILGAINEAKGAGVIEELIDRIDKDSLPIKITLIGDTPRALSSKNLKITGRYKREDLPKIIEDEKIDIFLIPSICPETFSYTTQEIIMMNMPIMVFNIGAPAERVKEYKKGIVIEPDYINNIIKYLNE